MFDPILFKNMNKIADSNEKYIYIKVIEMEFQWFLSFLYTFFRLYMLYFNKMLL